MNIKFKKIDYNAVSPIIMNDADAGADITAISAYYDNENDSLVYNTGIAVEIPVGYVGLLFARSSIYKKDITLANNVGVIDSGYRGEIKFIFKIISTYDEYIGPKEITSEHVYVTDERGDIKINVYKPGDRIGQLVIIPIPDVLYEEVTELTESGRGGNGFGSTGE